MNRIFTFLILVTSTIAFSQSSGRGCATPILTDSYEQWLDKYIQKSNQFANAKKAATVYNIPVIFHIIHNGEPVGSGRNISAAQIYSQMNILNQDFGKTNPDQNTWVTQPAFTSVAADCEINFSLANIDTNGLALAEPGIERINRNTMGGSGPGYSGTSEPGGYIDNTI